MRYAQYIQVVYQSQNRVGKAVLCLLQPNFVFGAGSIKGGFLTVLRLFGVVIILTNVFNINCS